MPRDGGTVKALVLTQYKHLELQEVERPSIGSGELLIAVRALVGNV